jgi:polysaccharide pyruvyl transferase WcaK-like protein
VLIPKESKTIAVFGHYGNLNLGDEAIILAVLENMKNRLPNSRLFCYSTNPDDSAERYGVEAFPIRATQGQAGSGDKQTDSEHKKENIVSGVSAAPEDIPKESAIKKWVKKFPLLIKIIRTLYEFFRILPTELKFLSKGFREMKEVDLLIIAGSNQFLDNFGGPWGFPYTVLKWAFIAKLAGTKVAFMSVGAGPLEATMSKLMARTSVLFADYISFRDEGSKQLIEKSGFRRNGLVRPDLAFSLLNSNNTVAHREPEDRITVGINLMAIYDPRYWCVQDSDKYNFYLRRMADFSKALVTEGHKVFFFGTQKKDENTVTDMLSLLRRENICTEPEREHLTKSHLSVHDLLETIHSADFIVATRFHGTVLSLFLEKPTLGVCYYRKARELLVDMGQEEYAVELDTFDSSDLFECFLKLKDNREESVRRIRERQRKYWDLLQEQYGTVLKLIV